MKISEDELVVQVENPIDFILLTHHKVDLRSYLRYQELDGYFKMLNGPTYKELVNYFWVRAEIYDKHAAKMEEDEKVLIDPSLERKTRVEMGLKECTITEMRRTVMGIPITIREEVTGKNFKRDVDGKF